MASKGVHADSVCLSRGYLLLCESSSHRPQGTRVRALHNSYRGVIPARSKSVNGPRSGHSGYSTS
jgi:hypothetical protein